MILAAFILGAPSVAGAQDLQDVNRLIKQGQHAQALDKLNAYLSGKPKDPLARFLKGVVLTEQGKTNEAINLFQALTEEYPELPEPYNNLAVLYASKGQYEKAKVSLEMAIQTHPSYATAHENLGDIYAKMASAAYDKALQLDKSNKSAETKLALVRDLFPANGKPAGSRGASAKVAPSPAVAPPVAAKETSKPAPPAVVANAPAVATPLPAAPAVAAPAVVPAAPTNTAVKTAAPAASDNDAVLAVVAAWAKAWSNRDVEAYLGFYVASYHPPRETHEAWKSSRRDRILAPKQISVEVLNPKVLSIDGNRAKVAFRQDYKSDRLATVSTKTLHLEKQGGAWRISQESSGK
ncbi:MAG: tetratricopeptide repeat protein [Burkholderiales bacterium]|nr:MAG: tetratricopeptide repeat protein [Burkholderiales bacterium]